MTSSNATRLAGEAYSTRLAHGVAEPPEDKTRIAQEGYQSKLARDAARKPSDASEFYKVGEKIGDHYEVLAIHFGEFGVVYGCFDHETKLPRALKTVRARYAHDKQVLSLFESEAAIWLSLEKHPYIVRAYVVERFKSLPFVITDYVRGPVDMEGDLRGWLGHPRVTLPVAVAMALQIAQGMQHAVRKVPKLVHRDLKPANILVNGDGKAMVTDFGLVHAAQTDAGTPAYMSPEQWRAEALTVRSDIYAYGCILFEIFTAHRLFPALTEREWETAHLTQMPIPPIALNASLPPQISDFIVRCLAKQVTHRPTDWDEVVLNCAQWFHEITGRPVVFDFSAAALSAWEHVIAGYSFHNLKRFEEALTAFEKALDLDANNGDTWFMKGLTLADMKRSEEALTAYDRAIALELNDGAVWHSKSKVLKELKRHDEAFFAYERGFGLDPNYSPILYPNTAYGWFDKGFALVSLKRLDEALSAYDQAISLDPKTTYPWNAEALVLQNSTLSEGAAVKGIVKNITDYGAFVFLGGVDGLLHITDLAWRRVKHPSEIVSVGDQVTAKVLKFEIEKNRVSLGLKQLGEDPWVGIAHRYPKGTRLFGEVIKLCDFGVWVEIEEGVDGLVHISDMDDTSKKNAHPSDIAQVGDEVEVMILDIDEERHRISLGMKQCMPNPREDIERELKQGDALADGKRYKEALAAFDQALVLNPDDAQAWFKKGTALIRLERFEDALSAFDHASSLDARGGVSFIKGFTLLQLKRYQESISMCDQALAANPGLAAAQQTKNAALEAIKIRGETSTARQPASLWQKFWGK